MHKIFGVKENTGYTDREGAYLIPVRENMVGVIRTPKGFFFVGGGSESGESNEHCIERECIEETGFSATVFDEVCSAEMFCKHEVIGCFHPVQTYYSGRLDLKVSEPTETDHELVWMDYDELKGKMHLEMQNWALEQCFKIN